MFTDTAPIATNTLLSALLHVTAIVVFLLYIEQSTTTGQGVEIESISSLRVSAQQETSKSRFVTSSRTAMPDRVALSAVQSIGQFAPARDYIIKAEEFRIDVVIKLLSLCCCNRLVINVDDLTENKTICFLSI